MGLFMAFIITLSVKMITSNDDALIEKDYYEKGLKYDETYNAKQEAVTDSVVPLIEENDEGLNISFSDKAKCKMTFKRLSDAKMDTTIERNTDEDFTIQVFEEDLKSGRWMLSLKYIIDNKAYLLEREINMP